MTGWAHRVRPAPGPRDLEALHDAAQDLAEQAGRPPGQGRNAFQTVYNVALLATVVLSGALAGVHLYKALFPRQREDRHERSAELPGDSPAQPPRRRRADAAGGDDYEHARSR
jgi:hypothetical protein